MSNWTEPRLLTLGGVVLKGHGRDGLSQYAVSFVLLPCTWWRTPCYKSCDVQHPFTGCPSSRFVQRLLVFGLLGLLRFRLGLAKPLFLFPRLVTHSDTLS